MLNIFSKFIRPFWMSGFGGGEGLGIPKGVGIWVGVPSGIYTLGVGIPDTYPPY